jgi:hypothetical protein
LLPKSDQSPGNPLEETVAAMPVVAERVPVVAVPVAPFAPRVAGLTLEALYICEEWNA